jgi:glycosyltransferase involved in cell wall biosynthesis
MNRLVNSDFKTTSDTMKSQLRILYLSPSHPTERSYGTQLRTLQVASALQALGQVDFVVVKLGDDEHSTESKLGPSFRVRRVIKQGPISSRSPRDRIRCSLDPRFTGYYGYSIDDHDREFVLNELPNYDLLWLHQLRTANVFGRWLWRRSVMDLDDVPSTYLRTLQQNAGSLVRRLRTGLQAVVARRRERLLEERFSVISVCSENDRRYLGFEKKVHVIPNGFARPPAEPLRQISTPSRVGFIGHLEYVPNVHGVRWFAEECWPRIKRQVPDARLRLIGKGSDAAVTSAGNDIDALGWVEDPASEIASWSVMVIPVRIGAGTRVKIADGFSRKCPLVSTRVGAFGYDVTNGRELFLADTPAEFAEACLRLLCEPADAAAMAERAWHRFLEEWTWDALAPRVWAAAEDCLRRSAGASTTS